MANPYSTSNGNTASQPLSNEGCQGMPQPQTGTDGRLRVVSGTASDDLLVGTDQIDVMLGGAGNDRLFGGAGDDVLLGGAGSDALIGGEGRDVIDGGEGIDSVVLAGTHDDYTVVVTPTGLQFTNQKGETDIVRNVEQIRFSGEDKFYTVRDGALVEEGQLDQDHRPQEQADGEQRSPEPGADGPRTNQENGAADGQQPTVNHGDSDPRDPESGSSPNKVGPQGMNVTFGTDANEALFGQDNDDLIVGGGGNDLLSGKDGSDTLLGGAGNDTLEGSLGRDVLVAGAGDDNLTGGPGDILFAGAGNDFIVDAGAALIDGGDGTDTLRLEGNFTEYRITHTGVGVQITNASNQTWTVLNVEQFKFGQDPAVYRIGDNQFVPSNLLSAGESLGGEPDRSFLSAPSGYGGSSTGPNRIEGTSGQDTLQGSAAGDMLLGGDYADTLIGLAGDDLLHGGRGSDAMSGNDGDDTLYGGDGQDAMAGGAGNDVLFGSAGNDTLEGGAGNDVIDGGDGTDAILLAGALNTYTISTLGLGHQITSADGFTDTVVNVEYFRFHGDDRVYQIQDNQFVPVTLSTTPGQRAGSGDGRQSSDIPGQQSQRDDPESSQRGQGSNSEHENPRSDGNQHPFEIRQGTDSAEVMTGTAKADYLSGNGGNDTLNGGAGNDTLLGGTGDDVINGGAGNDVIDGGVGTDTIVLDGALNTYTVRMDSFGHLITGADGSTDTAYNVEYFRFHGDDRVYQIQNNQFVPVNVPANPGQVAGSPEGRQASDIPGQQPQREIPNNCRQPDAPGQQSQRDDPESPQQGQGSNSDRENLRSDGNQHPFEIRRGTDSAEVMTGTAKEDYLSGNGGNDTLNGGAGNDVLFGGTGDDVINGGAGNDVIDGGVGTDTIVLDGALNTYTVRTDSFGHLITGADGSTDTAYNVEYFRFHGDDRVYQIQDNQFVPVNVSANPGQWPNQPEGGQGDTGGGDKQGWHDGFLNPSVQPGTSEPQAQYLSNTDQAPYDAYELGLIAPLDTEPARSPQPQQSASADPSNHWIVSTSGEDIFTDDGLTAG